MLPCHQRREEDQHCAGDVPERLEEEDLREDLEGGEFGQGAWSWRTAASGHVFVLRGLGGIVGGAIVSLLGVLCCACFGCQKMDAMRT